MSAEITASEVQPEFRLDFLPKHCGEYYTSFECGVFRIMDRCCPDYAGGFWNFVSLSNGGFYISPGMAGFVRMCNADNFFDNQMSPDAAGIAVSLMVLSDLAFSCDAERFSDKFHQLREYALEHKEAGLILGFID